MPTTEASDSGARGWCIQGRGSKDSIRGQRLNKGTKLLQNKRFKIFLPRHFPQYTNASSGKVKENIHGTQETWLLF